jgi:hypothetical protein
VPSLASSLQRTSMRRACCFGFRWQPLRRERHWANRMSSRVCLGCLGHANNAITSVLGREMTTSTQFLNSGLRLARWYASCSSCCFQSNFPKQLKARTWTIIEDIQLSETNQHKRTNTSKFHSYEVPRMIKHIDQK